MITRTLAPLVLIGSLVACSTAPSGAPAPVDVPSTNDAATSDVSTSDVSVANDVLPVGDVSPTSDLPLTGDGAGVRDAATGEMREVTVPARMIMPGEEITMCREVRLGNATPMLVRSIHVTIPRGSHHVIVYRSRATDEQPDLTPCRGLSGIISGTAPLFIAQQPESGIDFPAGVGLSIGANQMIRLEEHFINTSSAPLMVGARVRFDLAQTDGLTPADMMFWGTQNIRVAPRSMGSATYFRPALPGINVFGLTSHTHQFGVRSTIEVASSATAMGREVHRSETWEEPPLTRFSPPLTFSGGEGLRLVCSYNNTSDRTLTFGESYYEEMCFLWAYYYPSMGFHLCFDGLCRALPL